MLRRFSSFSLDTANQCIWRGEQRIHLAPKAWAVLHYLVEHPGRIVTKEELLEAVWPDTFVQEAVLKSCILDIRKALGESTKESKSIATIHRRGYRFDGQESGEAAPAPRAESGGGSLLTGRGPVLQRLRGLWEQSAAGRRQLVFVTGEGGIGKSTLLSHFVSELQQKHVVVLRGKCIEHFGPTEAYYPVFEALARGLKEGAAPALLETLRSYAPTWLVQMPGMAGAEERDSMKRETLGATRDRMLREMNEAMEVLASKQPFVFILEDLQWSDISTLDLLSWMAHRNDSAGLLLIASYRPVDAILSNHPVKSLKQNLLAQGTCLEIELDLLSEEDIATILDQRLPGNTFPPEFASVIHERTEGNPLFVHNVLDYAVSRSFLTHDVSGWHLNAPLRLFHLELPESLSQMIDTQIERLSPAQQSVLETASAVGTVFQVSLISGGDLGDAATVETCCEDLARRNIFIRSAGLSSRNGGVSAQYVFAHAVYRDIFYRRLSPMRRVRLHQTIGERLERTAGKRVGELSFELAAHFQESRDYSRAILYLRLAAQRCATRHALREAIESLNRALALTPHLSEQGRALTEVELTEQLGLAYRLAGQLSASAGEFEKMHELASRMDNADGQLRARLWLAGVASFLDRARCLRAADEAMVLSGAPVDPELRINALGQSAYWNLLFRGWDERDAQASEAALESARAGNDRAAVALHASRHSFFLSLSSRYREAAKSAREGVRIAVEIESLLDYSMAHYFEVWALVHSGDWGAARRVLTSAIDLARRNGRDLWLLMFGVLEQFLNVQGLAFAEARTACEQFIVRARELGHPLSVQMCLVLLGSAHSGLGDCAGARKYFEELREWQRRERILMDWVWRMPLQAGLVELCLLEGDRTAAQAEADLLVSATAASAERTWTGLAHHLQARVALAAGDETRARQELARGLAHIEDVEAPLAAWRLYSMAADVFRDPVFRDRARSVVTKLADSLPPDDFLRHSFVSSAPVGRLLAGVLHADA